MTSDVVVDVQPQEITIGILEDGVLVEFQRERREATCSVGNIYLGRVKKLMPGLNAAFVDVGYEKEGFIHYQDLGTAFHVLSQFVKQQVSDRQHLIDITRFTTFNDFPKEGNINDVLTVGQEILVQVVKEPISTKGPRMTCELSLPGRYMVLLPFMSKVNISSRIKTAAEKNRLKQIIERIKPDGFGVIVRTSAENVEENEFRQEFKDLLKQWQACQEVIMKGKCPTVCYEEESSPLAILRDIFNASYEHIWVNDKSIFLQIKDYVHQIAPDKETIVTLYEEEQPIADRFGMTRQIKSSLGKTVSCKAGAYIIIEHTEALHVIDVNSGHRSHQADKQEENALLVDLAAAEEIVHQMRLRDMGGIVVIDFIDLVQPEHRDQLFHYMKELMANDRAKHNILPLSKFCLMQITRERKRPVMEVQTSELCPVCGGKHIVKPSILFPERLANKLQIVTAELGIFSFRLHLHPFIVSYIRQGWFFTSIFWQWRRRFGFNWHLVSDESMELLQYKVYDENGQEISLEQPIDAHV